MPNTICRKNLSFTSYMEMRSIEDACLKMRSVVPYTTAMHQPMVATLGQIKPLQKYSKQASIGPRSLKIQGSLS